jgi:hypothetical protein
MADLTAIYHWTDGDTITAARLNTLETIVTGVNADFFQKNKASQTITVAFTASAAVTFSAGITVSASGIAVTGNSTITGTLTALTGITSSGTAAFATVTASATITAGTGLTVTAGNLTMSAGQAIGTRVDDGDSGTADTIDWNTGNLHRSRLTGNCTFTFDNPATGASYVLEAVQDTVGSRLATWPAAVAWDSGTAPTLTTTASRKDVFGFLYNGVKYIGYIIALNVNDTT